MTVQHVFYIPIIFSLGFIMGLMINMGKASPINQQLKENGSKVRLKVLYSFLIFILLFVLTHIVDLPFNSKNISKLLDNQEIFDKSPIFTGDLVYQKIQTFNLEGKEAYMKFTYTTDLIFPLAFLFFLYNFYQFIKEKSNIKGSNWSRIRILPFIWFFLDLLENAIVFGLLVSFPEKHNIWAGLLGYITVSKFTFLFASLLTPIIAFGFTKLKADN